MAARILVIEDNAANMELVRYLLAFDGHTVLGARDGATGLKMARSELPDLVICDLQMPVLDGYEVLAQLRADPVCAGLVVIAVTAFSMPNDRINVIKAGFEGYISKPIDPQTFVGQIEAFLAPPLRRHPMQDG